MNLVLERLDARRAQVDYLAARQRAQEELFAEFTPIAKVALAAGIERLDALEQDGTLPFVRELGEVGKKVIAGFSPGDVRELGEAIVPILQAVRAMTQPAVLAIAADAATAMDDVSSLEPLGMFGMARATRNDDVGKGMAIMVEVLRRVGKGATALAARQGALDDKKAKLAKLLGSRNQRKVLGVERKLLPAAAATRPAGAQAASASVGAATAAPGCAVPSKPQPTAAVIDGIAYTADGHLADASAWTRPLAEALAQVQGVGLTAAHWVVLDAARTDFETTKASPNIRRLTQVAGVTTKDLYTLLPKAPGRTIAKIAGLPKPAGCL